MIVDIRDLFGEGSKVSSLRNNWQKASQKNHCERKTTVMEFESDWIQYRKSSAYTAQVIRSATSFMPWSCRIPIGEGFYEFI